MWLFSNSSHHIFCDIDIMYVRVYIQQCPGTCYFQVQNQIVEQRLTSTEKPKEVKKWNSGRFGLRLRSCTGNQQRRLFPVPTASPGREEQCDLSPAMGRRMLQNASRANNEMLLRQFQTPLLLNSKVTRAFNNIFFLLLYFQIVLRSNPDNKLPFLLDFVDFTSPISLKEPSLDWY